MLKAYSIEVTGNVQGVGFRKAVQRAARKLNVSGSVENKEDGSVIIIAQGSNEELQSLVDSITGLKAPIKVEGIKKTTLRVSKTRTIFRLKRGSPSEEIEEGLAAGQEQLIVLGEKIDGFSQSTADNFNELARRYDNISETLARVVEESAKSREDFKRAVETLTSAQTKQFKDGLDTLTNLAREYFDERRAEWEKEK